MKRQRLLASKISLTLTTLLVISLACVGALAQSGSSTIRGTVSDPQGNLVAGATVTLTGLGTNTSRTATTEDNGIYSFELVPAGDYRVEVEAKGFKKSIISNVHAAVANPSPVDVRLEIGNVSETVTVTANGAEQLVNKEDATLGNVFVNQQITQLPLVGRSVPNLLTLQPGVTRGGVCHWCSCGPIEHNAGWR